MPTPRKKKLLAQDTVKVNTYEIISRAVESGVAWGWSRAHKHNPNPGEAEMKEHMEREIMSALCDVLRFGDD